MYIFVFYFYMGKKIVIYSAKVKKYFRLIRYD
jgi:hypothetical protein